MSTDPPFRWLDEGDGCFIQRTDESREVVWRAEPNTPAWIVDGICTAMCMGYLLGQRDLQARIR